MHKSIGARDRKQFRTQPIDHLVGACVAFRERFQAHVDEAAIGGAPASRESHDVRHRRIRFDDIDDALRSLLHGLERNVLRALDAAEHDAVILLGKESLGDDPKKIEVECDGEAENGQRQAGVFQDPAQAALVEAEDRIEGALAGAEHSAVLLIPKMP